MANKLKKSAVIAVIAFGIMVALYMIVNADALFNNDKDELGYSKNKYGLTYGTPMNEESLDEWPDLIAVKSDQGGNGYVYVTDMIGEIPKNPTEAIERQKQRQGKDRTINVYEADGKTVVGTFTLVNPTDETGT